MKDLKAPKMNMIPSTKMVKNEFSDKKEKHEIDPRPTFGINAEEFPDIKHWSVGKKYKMEIEAEMTGSNIGEYGDDKGKLIGQFRICGIMSDEDKDDKKYEVYPKAMQKKK